MQEATADDLIWGVAYQLADLSRLITLEPGDVVLTGTPANSRPMEPGDVVEVEVSRPWARAEHGRRLGRGPERGRASSRRSLANTLHVALAIPEDEAERRALSGETGA